MIYPQLEEINPKRAESYYKNRYPEFVQYLHNTYPDVIAFNEKLYWFYIKYKLRKPLQSLVVWMNELIT